MSSLIRVEQLCKTFHPRQADEMRAVVDVSLTVEAGAVVVLKGPSGSGKSTLLSLIGCRNASLPVCAAPPSVSSSSNFIFSPR